MVETFLLIKCEHIGYLPHSGRSNMMVSQAGEGEKAMDEMKKHHFTLLHFTFTEDPCQKHDLLIQEYKFNWEYYQLGSSTHSYNKVNPNVTQLVSTYVGTLLPPRPRPFTNNQESKITTTETLIQLSALVISFRQLLCICTILKFTASSSRETLSLHSQVAKLAS